ncbi:MAG: hypothetical protein FD123_731 [Bacteroidetes bacterium]|nr:MAG: hypothetical protein FD123_731 [Bacteroidota bacterium]
MIRVILLFSLFFSIQAQAQCEAKKLAKACKGNLKPYTYDGYGIAELVFDDKPHVVDMEFTAYAGEQYKLVFCSSGYKDKVKLYIYDAPKKSKKRQQVYDNAMGIDDLYWAFKPAKSGTYYIEIEVPPSADKVKKTGCLVMLIGFL